VSIDQELKEIEDLEGKANELDQKLFCLKVEYIKSKGFEIEKADSCFYEDHLYKKDGETFFEINEAMEHLSED